MSKTLQTIVLSALIVSIVFNVVSAGVLIYQVKPALDSQNTRIAALEAKVSPQKKKAEPPKGQGQWWPWNPEPKK